MPIYLYRCPLCGYQDERIEPVTAPPVHLCGTCQAPMPRVQYPGCSVRPNGIPRDPGVS